MERFRILTYNVLHGFEVRGWSITPSESEEARAARFNLQTQQLSLVQPDVVLLQEVNPLPGEAQAYVTALKKVWASVHRGASSGCLRHSPIRVGDRPRLE